MDFDRERAFRGTPDCQTERRQANRYDTTVVVHRNGDNLPKVRRGNVNKKGYLYIEGVQFERHSNLRLKIRLPGIDRWISCQGVVEGIVKRGPNWGVLTVITFVHEESRDDVLFWQVMIDSQIPPQPIAPL